MSSNVRVGRVGLAITLEPIKNMEIEFVPCFTDELRVVIPHDHDWANGGAVDWTKIVKILSSITGQAIPFV